MGRCLVTLRSPNRSARHAAQIRNRGPLSGCARFPLGNTVPGAPARESAHDYLVPLWPPEGGAFEPAGIVCKECITELWYRGDISQNARVEYIY